MSRRAVAFLALVGCGLCAAAQEASAPLLQQLDRNDLCVTDGVVSALSGGRLAIDTPSPRAVVRAGTEKAGDQIAEIRFRYMGPSQVSKRLASGQLRRQIGLKLRAENTCNLVYAIWRIEPVARVVVSIKRNPGMQIHKQCGVHGYVDFAAQQRSDLPPIRVGETHALRAELHGDVLTVAADGKVVWRGSLESQLPLPDGPPGFRADNARFELEYYVDRLTGTRLQAQHVPPGASKCVVVAGGD